MNDVLLCGLTGKKKGAPVQTEPPSVPVAEFFPSGKFPEGERQSYKDEYVPWSVRK